MSAEVPTNGTPTAWPRVAQTVFAFLLGAITILVVGRFTPIFDRARPTTHTTSTIDLNRADKADLMQLPHVSEKRAEQVLATRDQRGGFGHPADLKVVPGIGPKREAELLPFVRVEAEEQWVRPSAGGKKELATAPIDVNGADAEQLQRLPGIGKVLAARIIAERAKAPFRAPEDLRRVSGIGPKTLEKLRPFVRFD